MRRRSEFTKLEFTNGLEALARIIEGHPNPARREIPIPRGSFFALKAGERGKSGRVAV